MCMVVWYVQGAVVSITSIISDHLSAPLGCSLTHFMFITLTGSIQYSLIDSTCYYSSHRMQLQRTHVSGLTKKQARTMTVDGGMVTRTITMTIMMVLASGWMRTMMNRLQMTRWSR